VSVLRGEERLGGCFGGFVSSQPRKWGGWRLSLWFDGSIGLSARARGFSDGNVVMRNGTLGFVAIASRGEDAAGRRWVGRWGPTEALKT
jgi:hypothetical protein